MMTNNELSDNFDVLTHPKAVYLNEYEKSVLFTEVQQELIIELYNQGFEQNQIFREYITPLIKTLPRVYVRGFYYEIPEDVLIILNCIVNNKAVKIVPNNHELHFHKDPFFTIEECYIATQSDGKLYFDPTIEEGLGLVITYLKKIPPIILIDLPDGLTINGVSNESQPTIPTILHNKLLDLTVDKALRLKSYNINKQQSQHNISNNQENQQINQ